MKLIDADEAFRVLSYYYHHRTDIQHDALREALELVPEAVVRCVDCKRFKHYEIYRGYTLDLCEEYGGQPRCVELDDFCSHGVRRTDEID